jgi:hypothetical protein
MNDIHRHYLQTNATVDELRAEIGSSNWVIAKRTPRIVARYGCDVVCLTQKAYFAANERAVAKRRAAIMCDRV